jgi:hypothetical protein
VKQHAMIAKIHQVFPPFLHSFGLTSLGRHGVGGSFCLKSFLLSIDSSLASVGLFFVYFYCLDRRACLTWNLLCFLQVYLFVHWCWCHRLPRVSVWLHRSRDKKHLLLVLRILFWVPIRHHSFSFLKKMPFAMHKMLKKIL